MLTSDELLQVERLLAPELLRWRRHPSLALEALKEILGSQLILSRSLPWGSRENPPGANAGVVSLDTCAGTCFHGAA